jgi:hypothetical protein
MYRLVEPHNVRQTWWFVRQGLEHILRKSPEWWIPEDVYTALVENKANLWLWIENDRTVGFVVGYVNGESFHIWCAYGILTDVGESFRQLEDMVKGQCKRITFESWRSGWDRVARKLGFNPRGWVKEL